MSQSEMRMRYEHINACVRISYSSDRPLRVQAFVIYSFFRLILEVSTSAKGGSMVEIIRGAVLAVCVPVCGVTLTFTCVRPFCLSFMCLCHCLSVFLISLCAWRVFVCA